MPALPTHRSALVLHFAQQTRTAGQSRRRWGGRERKKRRRGRGRSERKVREWGGRGQYWWFSDLVIEEDSRVGIPRQGVQVCFYGNHTPGERLCNVETSLNTLPTPIPPPLTHLHPHTHTHTHRLTSSEIQNM